MMESDEFRSNMKALFGCPDSLFIKKIKIWGHKNGGCYVAIYERLGGSILCRKVPYYYGDVDWWFYRRLRPSRAIGGLDDRGVYISDMRPRKNDTWR